MKEETRLSLLVYNLVGEVRNIQNERNLRQFRACTYCQVCSVRAHGGIGFCRTYCLEEAATVHELRRWQVGWVFHETGIREQWCEKSIDIEIFLWQLRAKNVSSRNKCFGKMEKTRLGELFDYYPIEYKQPKIFDQKIIGSHLKTPTLPLTPYSVNEGVAKWAFWNPGGDYLILHIINLRICKHLILRSDQVIDQRWCV